MLGATYRGIPHTDGSGQRDCLWQRAGCLPAARKQIEAGIAADTKRFQPAKPPSGTDKGDTKGVPGTDGIIEGTKSYAGLTHNIGVYKKQLEAADSTNQPLIASLRQQVATAEQAVQVAVDAAKGWDLQNSGTIEEVDEVLSR